MSSTKRIDYKPARSMYEALSVLDFNEPLGEEDPRYVNTEKGRGEFTFDGLLSELGIDINGNTHFPTKKSYNLLCGHTGCGKSTELRRLANDIRKKNIFLVVFLDCRDELDYNNLHYPDIMMALAQKILEKLNEKKIKIDYVFLKNLDQWFSKKILKSEKLKDFSIEVAAGAEAKLEIPLLARLFGKVTGKIKTGATYKEEIRKEITNSFSDFAFAFNQLLKVVESIMDGQKILFIVDGTDKLNDKDSLRLFVKDVNQLKQIEANFLYCAPIHLLYEGHKVQQEFDHFTLPMIKIFHKDSNKRNKLGFEVLRNLVYLRISKDLFETENVVDTLIEYSGGSPRLLLKLIKYARRSSDMKQFRESDAQKAGHLLAMDFRRFLKPEDYDTLYKVDTGEIRDGSSPQIQRLLFDLAVLEYNSGWWRAHPVIRLLDSYQELETKKKSKKHRD